MKQVVTLIPGDGIGPEITAAAIRVLGASGAQIVWDVQHAGVTAMELCGELLPYDLLRSISENCVALKGPLTTPVGSGFRSVNVALRKEFDLFANVRPTCTMMPGGRFKDVDLLVVREGTEGLYVGEERWIANGGDPKWGAESIMRVTRPGAERIIRHAFDAALAHGYEKVTLAHKANILKYSQGLMLQVGREVAEEYRGRVDFEECIIDALCMKLVVRPEQFQVIVSENMFGDIISDLCAGLVGGLGLAPSANTGHRAAIFEPVHGSAPDIAGLGVANPTAMLLSAVMMLAHIGQADAAGRLQAAIQSALRDGETTRDLGGRLTTAQYADALVTRLGAS
jgi:isocitrate dehydrogenase (NAD+)